MGTNHYKTWAMAAAAFVLSGCAVMPSASVPPPPGMTTAEAMPVASQSPMLRNSPSMAEPALESMRPVPMPPPSLKRVEPFALPPAASRSYVPLYTDPQQQPGAPSIYYAPSVPELVTTAPAANSPQVLQAQPGPALSLDFAPNPAWRRAEVPAGSNAAAVGRVPPPAAAQGFTIGAGDTVQIDVLGRPELSARGNVSGDGRVTAALIGPINIAGLSPVQAAERISRAYKDGQYLVAPQVTVTMVEYLSQQLTVMGEVRAPGRFPMRTRLSVLDGLALAGGITEQGSSLAYLLRPEDSVVTRYEVDLDALIQSGAGQQYFELLSGDILVVPKAEVFYIYGEVKSPNSYKIKPGMTVIQALSLAGGLTDKGSDRRIDIRRKSPEGRLDSMAASLNDRLMADDVIYVRERLF